MVSSLPYPASTGFPTLTSHHAPPTSKPHPSFICIALTFTYPLGLKIGVSYLALEGPLDPPPLPQLLLLEILKLSELPVPWLLSHRGNYYLITSKNWVCLTPFFICNAEYNACSQLDA